MGVPKYQDVIDRNGWTGEIGIDMSAFDKLPKTPKKVFISSMGDLFSEKVSFYDVEKVIQKTTESIHTYLILTKRSLEMLRYCNTYTQRNIHMPNNLWLGVTVEDNDNLSRIDDLLRINAAVRFISFEPLLENVDIAVNTYWDDPSAGIHWVIIGCETGKKRRKTKLKWIENIVNQCSVAGIPVFIKQAEINGKIVKMPEINGKIWAQFPGEPK